METGRAATVDWPTSGDLICDQLEPDGSVSYRIEAHPEAGYLISGPAYGKHVLSADGRHLTCAPEGSTAAANGWQRLLIAQVLPFAALLRGLEVFHSSAVILDGRAIAFLGASRAGKTSVAFELCRGGGDFLADDVLAVERVEDRLFGHPGTPMAGLDRVKAGQPTDDESGFDGESSSGQETVAVSDRESLVRMTGATAPVPLGALFFLDRRSDGPSRPHFEPAADAQLLLTATFNFVLATPRRLHDLLDVCALAASRPVERIVIGPLTDAAQLSVAVKRRLGTLT
ncbi:MAG: hypothetical protein WBQ21_04470 [Solirubrobacteraceae bacterium]